MTRLPALLVCLRLLLAPLIACLLTKQHGTVAALLYFIAIVSDIFDGVIARRLKVATFRLRQADGASDVLLFVCVVVGLWVGYRSQIAWLAWPFAITMALQAISWGFCLLRFGKFTNYHSYLAKLAGLTLMVCIPVMLLADAPVALLVALCVFTVNLVEEIAMTAVLPTYHFDVWSLRDALRLRRLDLANDG